MGAGSKINLQLRAHIYQTDKFLKITSHFIIAILKKKMTFKNSSLLFKLRNCSHRISDDKMSSYLCTTSQLKHVTKTCFIQVAWRRHLDAHPLFIGLQRFAADQRFKVDQSDDGRFWTLTVDDVRLEDAGSYRCQVTSKEFASAIYDVQLNVKGNCRGPLLAPQPVAGHHTVWNHDHFGNNDSCSTKST